MPAIAAEPLLRAAKARHLDDMDGMLARREIRALVAHSRTEYEIVKGKQVGMVYDALVELEKQVNKELVPSTTKKNKREGSLPIRVTIIPVPYDQLYASLEAGLGDIAASPMLVTEYAAQRVDFAAPFYSEAKEVVVTQKGDVLGDGPYAISGRTIFVRYSSGFYRTLVDINRQLEAEGKTPARLMPADEHLSDDELMEMVNAKLIPATVTYRFRARLWANLFPDIHLNEHNVLVDHGHLAWAVRKSSPKLKTYLDGFVATHKIGTKYGNILRDKYFVNIRHARHSLDESGRLRFGELVGIFQRYADRYDFDHLLLMAQGYQESGLDQRVRSRVGAVGVMQVMPKTGQLLKVGNVHEVEPNIHAGTKYLNILREQYFGSPDIDSLNRIYFSFAAYNAGPGNLRKMRALAQQQGLNPNLWFDNVELVTLQYIGREPVQYVSNISKYYLAYRLYVENNPSDKPPAAPPQDKSS